MEERVMELFDAKRFSELKELLLEQMPADIALLFEEIEEHERPRFFRVMPKELASEVFALLDSDLQEELICAFSDSEIKAVMDELYMDDAVDVIEEMPASVAKRILRQADSATRSIINRLLAYPEDSAGSIMTTEYVDLKRKMTVAEAFDRIRKIGLDSETIYTCYVTDSRRKLIGIVTVRELLLASLDSLIGDIMETNVIHANTMDDKESVANLFERYDFLALPVVDNEGRLVGIVTVDDAIDVLQEAATEDMEIMAAITPSEKPYFKTGVFKTFMVRIPWLMLLMISATFTGIIIGAFESNLAENAVYGIALTCFMPMIMGTAGNSGSQSSVTIIRALSLGEVRYRDIFRIIWKELRVATLCGLALGAVNIGKVLLVDNLILGRAYSMPVILVISITLFATVVFAKFIGCSLPIVAKRMGFDPAIMASPLITTIVDALSLILYFQIAVMVLGI
ncbi:MAG: magnesium transporter [Clostridia bacterium]|nr:magnesium transporter [Clostridia bacterium]